MTFLIDADCPRSISFILREAGHTVVDIRDLDPATSDDAIYDLVRKDSMILITRDKDFSNILRYPVPAHCGIILLRVHLLSVNDILNLVRYLLTKIPAEELLGCLTVVRKERIRIHKF
ncbi:MAG: DUF5615 family PIN-like protein [Candidatus Omnitrophica bacterium]|nr:DUF5615 family PIN-like protein [Candidatus Omnitrophota bacterium]